MGLFFVNLSMPGINFGIGTRLDTITKPICRLEPREADAGAATMILQTAPQGQPRFAIKMDEHSTLAGEFAKAFGNDGFARSEPYDLLVYVVTHHDKGWVNYDGAPKTDPRTGFPYNLVETPAEDITPTSAGSPDFNERRHPYCGLLSSMHSWGLYNGRYGTSDYVLINTIPPQQRYLADRMLERELERQARLKATLASDPRTAPWIEDRRLFQNYKRLQFFDMLALYFNRTHEAGRGEMQFVYVPADVDKDATITIRPVGKGAYGLSPYPFAADGVEFSFSGRYIEPVHVAGETDWAPILASKPTEWQHLKLIAA